MRDWNVVVTLFEERSAFNRAQKVLSPLGVVAPTEYHNVLVMRVVKVEDFLRDFSAVVEATPGVLHDISRAVPLTDCFDFATREEFEAKARAVALQWAPRLEGACFYVRLHRRGMKGAIMSPEEERLLDDALLATLEDHRAPGKIRFDDPDFAIDIETVGHRAGMAIWSREDLARYAFLRID